jgi:hypothetical protein
MLKLVTLMGVLNLMANEMKRDYYNMAGVECEEIILHLKMDFSTGNAFKYVYRCNNIMPKGNIVEDLKKSIYNLRNSIKYSIGYRSTLGKKYVNLLDESVFSENLWNAIQSILLGWSDPYCSENMFEDAIRYIELELKNGS